jgi:cell division protein FtsA
LRVQDVLGGPLAAADAVLTPEEKELGVALIDVGAGTTETVVVHAGAIRHTGVLPCGGGHLTNDLAAALRTPFSEAENLKKRHGSAVTASAPSDVMVEVAGLGGRPPQRLPRRALAEVLEMRAEEILRLARRDIDRAGCSGLLTSGVVLTGGSAALDGIVALAERVFRAPVRLGVPQELSGLVDAVASPMYSTAVGLVLHGVKQQGRPSALRNGTMLQPFGRVGHRVIEWLRDFF